MDRRRRHTDSQSDDDGDERGRKRRRIAPEGIDIQDRLESLITRVGEKSTSSLESNLEGLAGVLEADIPNYKYQIMKILCDCVIKLPEKLTVYTTLVGLLNAKNYNCGGEFQRTVLPLKWEIGPPEMRGTQIIGKADLQAKISSIIENVQGYA